MVRTLVCVLSSFLMSITRSSDGCVVDSIVGNRRFRDAVSSSLPAFRDASNRFEKSLVVQGIVESIKKEGGRFLKYNQAQRSWVELNDQQANEKVGHAVRDAVKLIENKQEGKKKRPREESKTEVVASPVLHSLHQAFASLSSSINRPGLVPGVSHAPFLNYHPPQLPPHEAPVRVLSDFAMPGVGLHQHRESVMLGRDSYLQSNTGILQHANLHTNEAPAPTDCDHHDQFLARIDSVLGPLPANAEDPMESLFEHDDVPLHAGRNGQPPRQS